MCRARSRARDESRRSGPNARVRKLCGADAPRKIAITRDTSEKGDNERTRGEEWKETSSLFPSLFLSLCFSLPRRRESPRIETTLTRFYRRERERGEGDYGRWLVRARGSRASRGNSHFAEVSRIFARFVGVGDYGRACTRARIRHVSSWSRRAFHRPFARVPRDLSGHLPATTTRRRFDEKKRANETSVTRVCIDTTRPPVRRDRHRGVAAAVATAATSDL